MKSCLILVSDEKLARAVSAALRCAGIAAADGENAPGDMPLVIADEKSVVPEGTLGVIALYREERWLRSDTHAAWTERFGKQYAALRRPFLFVGDEGLTGIALRLLGRDTNSQPPMEPQSEPSETAEASPCAEAAAEKPPRLLSDPERGTVSRGDRTVRLTEREFALFSYFQAHVGEIVTREALREAIWQNEADPAANVTDVYVSYLRKKLSRLYGEDAGQTLLTSIRGRGYLLRLPPEPDL